MVSISTHRSAKRLSYSLELDHGISLPQDYRNFLASIGNGGAGPFYGVFRWVTPTALAPIWRLGRRETVLLARSACPFLLRDSWNDLSLYPPEELLEKDEAEYDRQIEKFEAVTLILQE